MYLLFDSELLTSNNLVRDMGREISRALLHSTDLIVMHLFLFFIVSYLNVENQVGSI